MPMDGTTAPTGVNKLYFAAWRWHVYAGLFVVPFVLMLALTGAFLVAYDYYGNELGYAPDVAVTGPALHEVPWVLEAMPLQASGSEAGTPAVARPVVLDTVVKWAEANGFRGQYKVALPGGDTGVYSVSIDGRNDDGFTPSDDRFVHIDRNPGNILADVPFADYPRLGKAIAWSVGLRKGEAGPLNFWFNAGYLALMVFLCISGIVMWWMRRPAGANRLAAPPMPADLPMWKGAVLVALATSLAFSVAGIALLIVLTVDHVVLANLPILKRALS